MQQRHSDDNVFWLLTKASLQARHKYTRLAEKDYGLTWAQMHTLCLLDPKSPMPMHVISGELVCDASNVTGIVDRLETQHYIERRDDPNDRRIKMIALTNSGTALRARVMNDIAELEPVDISMLTLAEQAMLQELLRKVFSTEAYSKS